MTLTALLPTLRHSIPDPLAFDLWPESTTATTTDVVVAGVSLCRLAEVCDTPCVHSAAAALPGTHGRPSPTGEATVVVATVLQAEGGRIRLDADLSRVSPQLAEARLLGRVSTARITRFAIGSLQDAVVSLPADVLPGDLVAVPCAGTVCLRDLRGGGR
ncbi:hypothetical protein NY547_12830 [Cnuibacter physcomitrellae]|uniref:hypothetical protein n=1 Tax=Cnuibacter physcomitrellae TaxID=1619308 RepID=UPI002175DC6E|nr:hypothetical protein [Cnuibacter physcomitrellae]MCS5498128.1 hypothetical protein [Cnuibacter physcomitrellae]